MQCAPGFYPWFDGCESCPEPFGWTPKNTFTVIYRYGIILVLWIAVNRVLCERLQMMDAYAPCWAPRVDAVASVSCTFGRLIQQCVHAYALMPTDKQVAKLRSDRGRVGWLRAELAR